MKFKEKVYVKKPNCAWNFWKNFTWKKASIRNKNEKMVKKSFTHTFFFHGGKKKTLKYCAPEYILFFKTKKRMYIKGPVVLGVGCARVVGDFGKRYRNTKTNLKPSSRSTMTKGRETIYTVRFNLSPPPFFRWKSEEVICRIIGILFYCLWSSKSPPFFSRNFFQRGGDLVWNIRYTEIYIYKSCPDKFLVGFKFWSSWGSD